MAHDEFQHLKHLVEYFSRDCYIFIHIDKGGTITDDEFQEVIKWPNVVRVYKKYHIHWGGFSMLKCETFLLKESLQVCEADYFHLLSGQDYPIKPFEYFLDYFDKYKGRDFISYVHLPHPRWQNNTFSRFSYYYPYDYLKHGVRYSKIIEKIKDIQDRIHLKRRIPDQFEHLYGGSQWFSLSRESVSLILEYTDKYPSFFKRLKWTFAPEECYIQTVANNILPKGKVVCSNLRFIRWFFENDNKPSNLGVEHFHFLVGRDTLIARKFKTPFSRKLVPLIDNYLLRDNPCVIKNNGTWEYNGYLRFRYDYTFCTGITRYCEWMDFRYVLDAGCGAGILVAALRRMGLIASGIDSNPYTPELSARLLSENDSPCQIMDLTDEISSDTQFDLVLCLDVLQYIPINMLPKAIGNLLYLTNNSLIVSCATSDPSSLLTIKQSLEESTQGVFQYNKGMSIFLQKFASVYQNIMLFERIK